MRAFVLTVAVAGALGGCSPEDHAGPPAPTPPGCDRVTLDGPCVARAGLTAAECVGTFRAEGCPLANVVGTCVDANGQSTVYYSPEYDAYFAHVLCDWASGTWLGTGAPLVQISCDERATVGTCTDASGPEDEIAVLVPYCAGPVSQSPCPTFGRSGTCSAAAGGLVLHERFYSAATVTQDQAACIADGYAWTPN